MLSWLSGDNSHTSNNQRKLTEEDELPDTPAPIFAVRAFKHAIYGTPIARRESAPSKYAQSRSDAQEKPAKIAASKEQCLSTQVLQGNGLFESVQANDINSPRPSGILLTPGITGSKRKTVSFGAERSKSPSVQILQNDNMERARDVPRRKQRARDAAAKIVNSSQTVLHAQTTNLDLPIMSQQLTSPTQQPSTAAGPEEEVTVDLKQPRSMSGLYWKNEFQAFSAESEQRLRQLAKQELLARNFAKHKEEVATTLELELKQEREQVLKLQQELEHCLRQLSVAAHEADDGLQNNDIIKDQVLVNRGHRPCAPPKLVSSTDTTKDNAGVEKIRDGPIDPSGARVPELQRENRRLRNHLRVLEKSPPAVRRNDNANTRTSVGSCTLNDASMSESLATKTSKTIGALRLEERRRITVNHDDLHDGDSEVDALDIKKPVRCPLQPRQPNSQGDALPIAGRKNTRNPITQERRDAARKRLAERRTNRQESIIRVPSQR